MRFNNVILISIDALRYDCVNYQENKQIDRTFIKKFLHTPLLNNLEKNSICFNNVFSTSSYTTAAHASLFTGLYPPDHNIRQYFYFGEKLTKSSVTLAESFKKRGFTTIAFSDLLKPLKNLDILRGFQHTFDKDSNFIQFIKNQKNQKNFIFIHLFDVHHPYLFSPSDVFIDNSDYYEAIQKIAEKYGVSFESSFWKRRPYEIWDKIIIDLSKKETRSTKETLLTLYLKGISKFDQGRFKIFYNFISQHFGLEKSIFFIFSDHGEGINKYNSPHTFGHDGHLSNEVLRVPLMVYSPHFKKTINNTLLSLKDLYPLVTSLLSKETPFNNFNFDKKNEKSVYAEFWGYDKPRMLKVDLNKKIENDFMKRYKKDYFLFERAIIRKNEKLILSFTPEYFIKNMNNFSFNRFSIRTIMKHVLRYESYPSRFVRYLYYLFALIPIWGDKAVLKKLFAKTNYPIFIYSKLNEFMEEKHIVTNNAKREFGKNKAKIANLIHKIFTINRKRVSLQKISKFLDSI